CITGHRDHRSPSSFPTRRSSDLIAFLDHRGDGLALRTLSNSTLRSLTGVARLAAEMGIAGQDLRAIAGAVRAAADEVADDLLPRSEEHTSELQSRSDLVCRLLLE